MPCPPPTIHDQSLMMFHWCPRSASAARGCRDASASIRRSRYTRTRGLLDRLHASRTEHVVQHLRRRLVRSRRTRVLIESLNWPSRKTCVGDIITPLRPGLSAFGESGSRSIHLCELFSTMPVPGTEPEPKAAERLRDGHHRAIRIGTRSVWCARSRTLRMALGDRREPLTLWRSSLTPARLPSMRPRWLRGIRLREQSPDRWSALYAYARRSAVPSCRLDEVVQVLPRACPRAQVALQMFSVSSI